MKCKKTSPVTGDRLKTINEELIVNRNPIVINLKLLKRDLTRLHCKQIRQAFQESKD